MNLSIAEILKKTSEAATSEQKIETLRKNDSIVLRTIIKYAFDPTIKFLLPEGDPPYKPSQSFESQGMLFSEARRLYLFVEGGNPNLNQMKRESLFIQLLEAVDPNDAKVLLAMKDKKLPYNVDYKLCEEAFEGLLPPSTTFQVPEVKTKKTKKQPKVKQPNTKTTTKKQPKKGIKKVKTDE